MSTLSPTSSFRSVRTESGFLSWIDWRFSLLFPIGVLLLVVTMLFQALTHEPEILDISVRSNVTNGPLSGAVVQVGKQYYRSNEDGVVRIERPATGTTVQVSIDGYHPNIGFIEDESSLPKIVAMRPSTLQGRLTDAATGDPIGGVTVTVVDASGSDVASSTSDERGAYLLRNVPIDGLVRIQGAEYGVSQKALTGETVIDFALERQVVAGRIVDEGGEPIQGAIIRSGDRTAVSAGDGSFEITGVGAGSPLMVAASGFEDLELSIPESMTVPDIQMTGQMIRALYANLSLLSTPGGLDQLIEIANTTEINAVVVDIKQDTIYYDSDVPFFEEAGTVSPIYDINEVLTQLKENDIYAIARLVVFQDPLVAEARPELAVLDGTTGDLWRNELGIAWVNAFNEELWDANIALALEALSYGFDEIQYDYVRFPSDGDLSTAEFGQEYTAEARETAITSFMKRSYEAIHANNGKLAADLFGFVTLVDDEQYIGQRFSALEPYLDFVCMMIYPSHFEAGNIASADGHPNDFPYETIYESLERAEANVPGSSAKFRPWLQDFSYGGLREYTADDVRAQIDAAEAFGASGWMLWGDPFDVTVEALEPEIAGPA